MGRRARTAEDSAQVALMGQRLKWVREARGLSQAQIAAEVGVHQTQWSLYERGKCMPDAFAGERMVAKLKITKEYLFGGGLDGVERVLAIRLAAHHPELVDPIRTAPRTDKDPA